MNDFAGGDADKLGLYSGEAGRRYHLQREGSRAEEGQRTRAEYFAGLTSATDTVLDFGCATGGVLANTTAARRIGIEVNELAAAEARLRLDEVQSTLDVIPDNSVDAAISFHAIEHVPNPYEIFTGIYRVLKPGGRFRVILPYDSVFLSRHHRRWTPGDTDMHLFCWTPLHIGNLLTMSGFEVEATKLSPYSGGGRLAQWFRWAPPIVEGAKWYKAAKRGTLQVITTCRKPANLAQ